MQDTVIIMLQSDASVPIGWFINEEPFQYVEGECNQLKEVARDKRVIVIVPGEDVLLTQVSLPKMSRSRLLQALPFALEEQLISEIDQLHFAIAEMKSTTALPVAVVSREKMCAWRTQLMEHDIEADAIVPSMLSFPWAENSCQIVLDQKAIVRYGFCEGFVCDVFNLTTMLRLLPTHPSQQWHVNCIETSTLSLTDERVTQVKKMNRTEWLRQIGTTVSTPALNLLQGIFANKKSRMPPLRKMLKVGVVLCAVWMLFLFLYPLGSYFILQQRVQKINKDIAMIYKRQFPQSTSIVAPRLRMEEKLHVLNNDQADNRLFIMLSALGNALSQSSGIKFERFDYQTNRLRVDLSAASSEDFSSFLTALNHQSLNVKQENATLVGARVNATLNID